MKTFTYLLLLFYSALAFAGYGPEDVQKIEQTNLSALSEVQARADAAYALRDSNPDKAIAELESIARKKAQISQLLAWVQNEKQRIASGIGCVSGSCMDGYGKYIVRNGASHEGYFSGGKRNGSGVYIRPDGTKFQGVWEDDKLLGNCKRTVNGLTVDGVCTRENGKIAFSESKKYTVDNPTTTWSSSPSDDGWPWKTILAVIALALSFLFAMYLHNWDFDWLVDLFSQTTSSSPPQPSNTTRATPHTRQSESPIRGALFGNIPSTSSHSSSGPQEIERKRLRGIQRIRPGQLDGNMEFDS